MNQTKKQGRLSSLPGFVPIRPKGMWTREQRRYLVLSVASQENPDQQRAKRILERMG